MSRDWLALYVGVLVKPKYRRLSIPARAALFHVWMLAGGTTPEATWRDEAELVDLLELDGYPDGVLAELRERGWLDVDEDGRILVHDWDDHQLAATLATRRAYERDRKADWRRRPADPLPPAPPSPDKTGTQQRTEQLHHRTGVPNSPGRVRDNGQPTAVGTILEKGWCPVCRKPLGADTTVSRLNGRAIETHRMCVAA